jgi:hypothetical protein
MARLGAPVRDWRPRASSRGGLDAYDPSGTPIPTGSQRALAVLRRFVDEAGARSRGYVRIVTDAPALAAPDQAVVAAFERIDVVIADPMREIVSGRVDPDRALADHVFAHRLLGRAGTNVLVPGGPLLVTPDIATGVPSDTATRAGRALALQLLAVALARRDGLAASSIAVGAVPDWLIDEPDGPARCAAEVALRRALLPAHALAFVEPPLDEETAARWQGIVGALLPDAGGVETVVRRTRETARATRAMLRTADSLRASRIPPELTGVAAAHATGAVSAALRTLEALEDRGWGALVDQPLGIRASVAVDSVVERTESFDPLGIEVPLRA